MRTGMRVALALVLVAGLLGLQQVQATAQAVPRQLRVAIGIDADRLDPAEQTTTTIANVVDYMFETLVDLHPVKNEIVPRLATRWQISRDGLTYTFTLRRGVRFHDGTPFNAEAVKFTFERLQDPRVAVALRFLVQPIKSIEAVGDDTVRITLSKVTPTFLSDLSTTQFAILSPAAVQRAGDRWRAAPVGGGTGPYVFKEWRRGDSILLERNPNYWGKKPIFDEILFRVVPDAGTRLTQVLAGDVHQAMLPPAPDVKGLRRNPRVTVVEAPSDRVISVLMNTQWGPFKDVRVRQAMNYAVNKKAILASVLFDLGTVVDSPCPSMMFGYSKVQDGGWPFNPIKAKQLLAEAGYKDGFEVNFFSPTGRYIQDFQFAQAIAAQLRNVNVRANVSTMDWPSYVAMIQTPPERTRVQMIVLGWAWPVLDCDGVLYGQFHSSSHPPRGLGPAFYNNPKVDQLLERERQEANVERRKALMKEAQEIIWQDAPWIWLWSQKWYVVTVKNLEGVLIHPIEKWTALCEPEAPAVSHHCVTWK
ncbi:MAG: ABC transporter substrate-binding protein [Armatimonadota bacterium]|nr:ABC transporter substrate-binding protein [Armatimonadota bacterium]